MSLNDPEWGRGNRNGPPDLEELWRDFNRRLSGVFGQKGRTNRDGGNDGGDGGGDGGDGGNRGNGRRPSGGPPIRLDLKRFGGGVGLLVILAAVLWMASGFYVVDASQRGVVLQFGRYKETTEPGLRWRLPSPIQSHDVVNVTGVRTVEVGYRGSEKNKVPKEALMLTDDENIVSVQFAVQYLLKDPKDFLFNNRSTDDAVMGAAETAIREVVGKNKMDFVLYEGRDKIAGDTAKLIQDILDRYKSGVLIRSVTMQSTQPPEQVQAAFDDAVKAGQDRERQKNEGQAYANDVIPRAQGASARLMAEANGYKSRVVANAEGEASRFKQVLVEYQKAPEVMRSRLYLDTVQQVLSSTSKVMVDSKAGSNLLYLPLDKLMQAAGAPAAQAETAAAAAGHTTPAPAAPNEAAAVPPQLEKPDMVRSRDALRTRERGER